MATIDVYCHKCFYHFIKSTVIMQLCVQMAACKMHKMFIRAHAYAIYLIALFSFSKRVVFYVLLVFRYLSET